MKRRARLPWTLCVVLLVAGALTAAPNPPAAAADGCQEHPSLANIAGSQDTAVISGRGARRCGSGSTAVPIRAPAAYVTHQIVCSPNRTAALDGVCSATPCRGSFFALRTLHQPDGTSRPAGFRCVTLGQASAAPGVSAAQVFAAVRRVRLPGGRIGAVPDHQGLANLPSFFFLRGVTQPPVDLQVGGSSVHAVFRVLEYRWAFGDGQVLVTSGPGSASLDSEVRVAFGRRGRYRVAVTVAWVAEAFLDGRRVGQVDGLASRAQRTYPVAEVRAVLTG